MGHRHVFSPSYMFETENDHRWNLTEHPYAHMAQSDAAESSSHTYPANNMLINEEQYYSHCTPAPVSNSYSSLNHNPQNPHYQQDTLVPSNVPAGPENYGNTAASSSNNNGLPVHEDDSLEITGSNGRWHYKRKSPAVPSHGTNIYNNNDSNNNYNNDGGSSSEICMPTDPWEETTNMEFFHSPWDYPNNAKPVHEGESSVRNVRSRAAPDNLPNGYYTTGRPMDVSSNGSIREWNPPTRMSSSLHGHELNPFFIGSSNLSNHVQDTQVQSVRGTRSNNYIQRSAPNFRASSSSLQLGHSNEELQLTTESYSSPHVRPTITWRSSDRDARSRMSIERYRSFHDRSTPEGHMIVDRSAFQSRNPFDHHGDMRLDIDDMSYEDLLALGERIGSVSTGLSDDLISKCLRESIYCSSDQMHDEGTCVICLEEYANMDNVGMLKGCKHDFHVGCIKKWLSMKNLCPICKSEPMKQK